MFLPSLHQGLVDLEDLDLPVKRMNSISLISCQAYVSLLINILNCLFVVMYLILALFC